MKKTLSFFLALCLCFFAVITVSAASVQSEMSDKYQKQIIEKLDKVSRVGNNIYYNYEVVYEHYSDSTESFDVATPDYVLIFTDFCGYDPALSYGVFGDYVVRENNVYCPYTLGYYVFVPSEDALYTLREAWDMSATDIECAFTTGRIGELIGDMDCDGKLSVKDVTKIQKYLAGIITDFELDNDYDDSIVGIPDECGNELSYVSDFNRDCERNIKDATAIQKHIAGLEY